MKKTFLFKSIIATVAVMFALSLASCKDDKQSAILVKSVTMNPTAKELSVGDSFQLEATVSPTNATDKTLIWSSSNDYVTVDQLGRIKAEKEGTAVITATAKDGGGAKATCEVTVKAKEGNGGNEDENGDENGDGDGNGGENGDENGDGGDDVINVETITITPSTKELSVGDTFQLDVTVLPANATDTTLTWTSSNDNVTVDSLGKVTAVKVGTSEITATIGSVSSEAAIITVTEAVPTSIKLTATPITIAKGMTSSLSAVVTYLDGTTKTNPSDIIFTSLDTNIVTISGTTAKGNEVGKSDITATIGSVSSNKVKITVIYAVPTSIQLVAIPTSISEGKTSELSALVRYSDGTFWTNPSGIEFTSSNPNNVIIERVNKVGREEKYLASGKALGTSEITAKIGSIISNKVIITVTQNFTQSDYYEWDAYAPRSANRTGWGPGSSSCHEGDNVTATQSCKDCCDLETAKLYLSQEVYWDEAGPEYTVDGKSYRTGLWVKKKQYISTSAAGQESRVPEKLSNLPETEQNSIRNEGKYFFLPAAGYHTSSFRNQGYQGCYWLSTPGPTLSAYSLDVSSKRANVSCSGCLRYYAQLRLFAE